MANLTRWMQEHGSDVVGFFGVGMMALGVGIQHSLTGAIAVFALGLPILSINRHMKTQSELNLLTLEAIRAMHMCLGGQQAAERMTVDMVRDLHKLLKRIADEGITRE